MVRKFPFPFKSMLAISSDLDNTHSLKVYSEMMKFLNTDTETSFGRGFGLEVGNSFWFYNGTQTPQVSYFSQLTQNETSFSGFCRELWKSGHIKTSYGNRKTRCYLTFYRPKILGMVLSNGTRNSADTADFLL